MKTISPFKILDDFFRLYIAETEPTVNNEFYVSHKRSLQDICYVIADICYEKATKFNVILKAVSTN
jgi:hypothetical protein